MHPGSLEDGAPRPLQRLRVVADGPPEDVLDLRLVGDRHRQPAMLQHPVARVEQHRHRGAALPPRQAALEAGHEPRRDQPRAVVRHHHRVASRDRVLRGPGHRVPRLRGNRGPVPIDPHHLLPGRVDAPREDAGLRRRPIARQPDEAGPREAAREAPDEAAAGIVPPDETHEPGLRPEGGHVAGGVARAPRPHLGGVVLEDEHGGLARHAVDAAVDELVGDDVADDEDAGPPERSDQTDEAGAQRLVAGPRMNRGQDHRTSRPRGSDGLMAHPPPGAPPPPHGRRAGSRPPAGPRPRRCASCSDGR